MKIWLGTTRAAPVAESGRIAEHPTAGIARSNIIFTADDFGRSESVNRAILRAHEQGVLTSASMIMSAPAAVQAVAIAKENPSLSVGLHLTVTEFPPVLPPGKVDCLVGRTGKLRFSPVFSGLRYALGPRVRRQLHAEIRAQFERFADTGLVPSHVDGHMHMHIHPAIAEQVMELARIFGFSGIRLPRESMREAIRPISRDCAVRLARTAALHLTSKPLIGMASRNHLCTVDRVYGIAHSGNMNLPYVLRVLEELVNVSSAELIFHPGEAADAEPLGSNPNDLATLISPELRLQLKRLRLQPATYGALQQRLGHRKIE